MSDYIAWLDGTAELPASLVGGKGASLARLAAAGFPVPPGFAVTAHAYRDFHHAAGLHEVIAPIEALPERPPMPAVREACAPALERLESAGLPEHVAGSIHDAYARLADRCPGGTFAVRSSGASEDGAAASFAGLYESFLNLSAAEQILAAVRDCYCCLWQPRAVHYRQIKRIGHRNEAMATVVMETVRSAVSGVAFTRHPVTGATDAVLINSSWGLGEAIVSGMVTPDNFLVAKTGEVRVHEVSIKEQRVVPVEGGTATEPVPAALAGEPSLTSTQLQQVAETAVAIEAHYGRPMDIEFAYDHDGRFYLLQARPITAA